ncbi:hypothetical protein Ahu01nite_015580 [Winogradskya humida]|uniref:Uncharacterized protein n=1 Tax=Winogradskya humida TaxID=113566 RepID=A0ABQ3ZIQ0_9ACTN|nr:hypothetical protein Ahu01nite_015580 [Actinoplanes humidus]
MVRRAAATMRAVNDDGLWYAMPVLQGERIRLEPLTIEHAEGYRAAAGTAEDSAEIFRWQSPAGGALAVPATVDDARGHIMSALAARARGQRGCPMRRSRSRPGGSWARRRSPIRIRCCGR